MFLCLEGCILSCQSYLLDPAYFKIDGKAAYDSICLSALITIASIPFSTLFLSAFHSFSSLSFYPLSFSVFSLLFVVCTLLVTFLLPEHFFSVIFYPFHPCSHKEIKVD